MIKSTFVPCQGTLPKMTHAFFMRYESCHVYMMSFTFYNDININAVSNRKDEGAHSHTFKLAYYNFPMLIMRGVCEVDDSSCGHCLQYTYMYMTKQDKKV